MSESRKNHLSIDGGQVKEDDQVASYKPIPDAETEFRSSKSNLSKSKEKVSADGAEEKLLPKEEEAKIVTRVDMADAKYVVGDHRNGDAKIELDANKRLFTGLTKEELLKYADDPFWVRLRWLLFILFWGMWACMLAGAIVIIVQAPKCAPPAPKTWFEKGPIIDMEDVSLEETVAALPRMQSSSVEGVFVDAPAYEILDEPALMDKFKTLFTKAKDFGIKVIVDLVPTYVSTEHKWFKLSENKTKGYEDYFVWRSGKDLNNSRPNRTDSRVSTTGAPAWSWSDVRGEYYLHHYEESQPYLYFGNPAVVERLDALLRTWMQVGAAGVRLEKVRYLLVDLTFEDELPELGSARRPDANQRQYAGAHTHITVPPEVDALLPRLARTVTAAAQAQGLADPVFTVKEPGRPEQFLRNLTSLRPHSAAPIEVHDNVTTLAAEITQRLGLWPLMQLKASPEEEGEVAALALLLPAAPVLTLHQLIEHNNTTPKQSLSHLVKLRSEASVQHGFYDVMAVRPRYSDEEKLIACARWKPGHEGYVAVLNPSAQEFHANLTGLRSVPGALTLKHISHAVSLYHGYSNSLDADDVLVPPKSTVVLSYVPITEAEN